MLFPETILLNTERSSLLKSVIYINFNFVFTLGPILRQGQVSMYDVFKRLGCVVDILDFLVLAAISINNPPGEFHFGARFHFLQFRDAMDRAITRAKNIGALSGIAFAVILCHVYLFYGACRRGALGVGFARGVRGVVCVFDLSKTTGEHDKD